VLNNALTEMGDELPTATQIARRQKDGVHKYIAGRRCLAGYADRAQELGEALSCSLTVLRWPRHGDGDPQAAQWRTRSQLRFLRGQRLSDRKPRTVLSPL